MFQTFFSEKIVIIAKQFENQVQHKTSMYINLSAAKTNQTPSLATLLFLTLLNDVEFFNT